MNIPPNNDVFYAISQMKNLEELRIELTNITEIPSYAFKSLQNKLKIVCISGINLKTINSFAFYNLNFLTNIHIEYSSIHNIPSDAFSFRTESNETISITLDSILINGTNINANCLQYIGRPVVLQYYCDDRNPSSLCSITYLDENIFENFLNSNQINKIVKYSDGDHLKIDCNDCRSYWLMKNTKMIDRIEGLKCSNSNQFTDKNNFRNCTDRKLKIFYK
jgi:hypothetical protein